MKIYDKKFLVVDLFFLCYILVLAFVLLGLI